MGIRFNTNTWRAPLLIIDSWLPQRAEPTLARPPLPAVVRRFARAGWLGRPALKTAAAPTPSPASVRCDGMDRGRVRRAGSREPWGRDKRLVLAGRLGDVCAELDRLVAMEQRLTQSRA